MIETPSSEESLEEVFERVCTPENMQKMLNEILPRFDKHNTRDKIVYAADFRFGKRAISDEKSFYWDTNMGLRLYADGNLIGCIGFTEYNNRINVVQLQSDALPGQLPTIRWERILVELLAKVGAETGRYTMLEITRAEDGEWYNFPSVDFTEDELREYQERMKRRYNGTARGLGFKLSGDCWERPIQPAA